MSQAGKNLKYLRKLKGWTQEEFANKLKIKRSLLGAYEEERADPRIEVLEIVSSLFKTSLDELLLKDLAGMKPGSYLDKRRQMKMTSNTAEIQFVPVKAAAGYLAGYTDPDFIDELNTFTLPMLSAGHYRAFEIIGDSMLPTPSGSVIVGEKVEDVEDIKTSNTYIVVSRNEGIVYKRVLKSNRNKSKLTLVSDNPQYEPYSINSEEIMELWQAQMIIAKANVQQRWDVNQLAGLVNNLQDQISTLKKKIN
ncbi:LexA family transcriptional regulator [Segetibacter sp. 3557_3]|uniref:XRE family transcriptional regulator n=1 Tax=Segetibacter sp. 3557_3 TaxID=2547429 RepID=UPI001058513B|nr:LexA family transcriptional regulator [Segetibacter sp. 3557_3]TDH28010.1 LexA family transcriptional regulator [Segetibacter sp. 3557_3]